MDTQTTRTVNNMTTHGWPYTPAQFEEMKRIIAKYKELGMITVRETPQPQLTDAQKAYLRGKRHRNRMRDRKLNGNRPKHKAAPIDPNWNKQQA